ncbi:MAG: amino acid adenylation domain-containing protein [Acidobacteriota bacterium]
MAPLFQTNSEDVAGLSQQEILDSCGNTLASWFTQSCERHAKRVAISLGSEQVTYAELQSAAMKIAAALAEAELAADALVAIHLERSTEMVAAMAGVILAGAAYLPLDPQYPTARVRETLEDAKPVAILTDRAGAERLRDVGSRVLVVEELLAEPLRSAELRHAALDDLAYVIYTSGSTGKPKGVMVTHRNVARLLKQTEAWFHFDESDVWTMFHSFAFDFSVWEMWGCLLYGGRLVVVPHAISRSPDEFYALLAEERVTVLNQTPTAFGLLMQAEARGPARELALRLVIFGGEALNLRSLVAWFGRHGEDSPQLVNMYGITETTVHVTYRRIYAADAQGEVESLIGEPIPDLRIHLLDEALLPVEDGTVGEIFVGGEGVARGYLNRPELTAERFLADPLVPGAKLYRSGDLACRRADGELVYMGRADRQVKVNGFRIELGEIEARLLEVAGVAQVCVVAREDNGAQRLAGYVVADSTGFDALARFAEQHLPIHMRPAVYVRMDALPINANGKIDRTALPEPRRASASTGHETAAASSQEKVVAEVWQRVLGTEHVGLDENFFDAGGSSVMLIALRTELQTALKVTLPVTWLFEHTTIRSLAARLERETQVQTSGTSVVASKAQQQRDSFARMRALRGSAR